jgi:hypothetical protein
MKPDYKAFAQAAIKEYCWGECGEPDGGDLQDLAVKHGVLKQIGFNPDEHDDEGYGLERGDPWFLFVDAAPSGEGE